MSDEQRAIITAALQMYTDLLVDECFARRGNVRPVKLLSVHNCEHCNNLHDISPSVTDTNNFFLYFIRHLQ